MKITYSVFHSFVLLLICLAARPAAAQTAIDGGTNKSRYETRLIHDPNGTGKFYLGREIARVMGHEGAEWLERRERQDEERPDLLVEALKLKPGDVVADIGAGTGYYCRRMAVKIAPKGLVYAVDIQPEMLDAIQRSMKERKLENFKTILGTETAPGLPPLSMDLVLMVDVYHEFSEPFEMVQAICASIKPGGRLVFVEYRAEDPNVPIKEVHKMTEAQVRKEMECQPLVWVETIKTLPWQHVIVFKKSEASLSSKPANE